MTLEMAWNTRPLQLVLSGGSVIPTPTIEYNGLRGENRGPFKGQQASTSNSVRAGNELNSMTRRNLRDFDLNPMIRLNLHDFVNGMESFSGTSVVPRDTNFDNVGDKQNDLILDIHNDNEIARDGINPDEFTQTLQNVSWGLSAGLISKRWDNLWQCSQLYDLCKTTRDIVSPGFGNQNTGCLDAVDCDAHHDYNIGINWAPALNLYQTGYEIKYDERFTSCGSDVNPFSSEPCDAGNMSIISTTEHVGVTWDFDNFRGFQTDINIVHLIPTCTDEFHLHFRDDTSSEHQLFEVWVSSRFSVIRR